MLTGVQDTDAIAFVLALGKALHRYGTPADRLEQALNVCCRQLGVRGEVFTSPTTIIMNFGIPWSAAEEPVTRAARRAT